MQFLGFCFLLAAVPAIMGSCSSSYSNESESQVATADTSVNQVKKAPEVQPAAQELTLDTAAFDQKKYSHH